MAERDGASVIQLGDGESNRPHAVFWSRSGKRLIVTVAPRGSWDRAGQVELEPSQVERLRKLPSQTVPQKPPEGWRESGEISRVRPWVRKV